MKTLLVALSLLLAVPAFAQDVEVKGKKFGPTVSVDGKDLKRVGAGLRKKWGFSVYAMGVYTEGGACDAGQVIKAEEAKYLRLDFLRDVPAEKMSSTLSESFEKHTPASASADLKKQIADFLASFKEELKEDTKLEFVYTPGAGTVVKQNGKQFGPTYSGKGFQHVLWDIYFGPDTCCSGLKEDIFETCGKK